MIPEAEPTHQPEPPRGSPGPSEPPPQMAAEAPRVPQAPGYPPAFSGTSGGAWVFRDFASI